MIKITIIGGGNVAWSLIERVTQCPELELVGVVVRRADAAEQIIERFNVEATTLLDSLPPAQLYLLAVSDEAISPLSEEIAIPHGAVTAHTAGSMPLSALSQKIEHRAVIYPMQTFTRGVEVNWEEIPIFIEGSSSLARALAKEVASALSGSRVDHLTSEERKRLHIAAVFGCNFTNALLEIASQQLREIGLPLSTLEPLLEQTLHKALESPSPAAVQTGPAVRGDIITQQSHLEMLNRDEQREIYKLLSSTIWKTSRRN